MNKQPFRLGTGWGLGFRGGDWGLIHGDVQWTNNHLGWELGGDWGLGVGTGDLYMEMFYNEQTTI